MKEQLNKSFSRGSFMTESDICALFSNALDNAIEACSKVPDRPRMIRVRGGCKGNILSMRIENSTVGDLKIGDNGLPITDKGDNSNHGIGTFSMKSVLDKFNGYMSYSMENKNVVLKMLIPLPEPSM